MLHNLILVQVSTKEKTAMSREKTTAKKQESMKNEFIVFF